MAPLATWRFRPSAVRAPRRTKLGNPAPPCANLELAFSRTRALADVTAIRLNAQAGPDGVDAMSRLRQFDEAATAYAFQIVLTVVCELEA